MINIKKNISHIESMIEKRECSELVFVNDEKVIGKWELLKDEPFPFNELYFLPNGKEYWVFSWTKGYLKIIDTYHPYEIVDNILVLSVVDVNGEIGKKIHSGRSRNDQVLVDLKLFLREEVEIFRDEIMELFNTLQQLSEKYKNVLLPGYTHAQIAMPSSFGMWFGAYAEALVDDMHMLKGAYNVVNQNPLGSAAGYGSSFPLDRDMTTSLLGFKTLNYNSVAAQLSRGKSEKAVAGALGQLALTLNKFAADCCMYMCPNFGFISFPDEFTTGSSIMPHKKNPDVWEILRGKCNRIQSLQNEISLMTTNMAHGYHRDYQLLKDVLFPGLELMHSCLFMAKYMLENISVKEDILNDKKYEYLFTVEEVNKRVLEGMPFREAYKSVGIEANEGKFHYSGFDGGLPSVEKLHHTHKGSIGNLCTEEIKKKMEDACF